MSSCIYAVVIKQNSNGLIGYWRLDDAEGGKWVQRKETISKHKSEIYKFTKEDGERLAAKLQIGENKELFTVTIEKLK